ncbi:hypothetical protein KAW65_01645 [candidate division WOR-3 bacterium]|nr:hypothetical protein [candidate division WOR-3 bacterium]
MKRGASLLAMIGIAIILFGCQNARIKQAVEGLKKDIADLGTKIEEGKSILMTVVDIEAKVAEKPKKSEIAGLLAKIDETKLLIDKFELTSLKEKVGVFKDSLVILDKKARGTVKEDIAILTEKVDNLNMGIAALGNAGFKLESFKVTLEKLKAKPGSKRRPKVKAKYR